MNWQEIKALPDQEFLQAISRKEFKYHMFKSFIVINEFGSFALYQSGSNFDPNEWTLISMLHIEDQGIFIDTWLGWIKVRERINRDLITLLQEEKGGPQ